LWKHGGRGSAAPKAELFAPGHVDQQPSQDRHEHSHVNPVRVSTGSDWYSESMLNPQDCFQAAAKPDSERVVVFRRRPAAIQPRAPARQLAAHRPHANQLAQSAPIPRVVRRLRRRCQRYAAHTQNLCGAAFLCPQDSHTTVGCPKAAVASGLKMKLRCFFVLRPHSFPARACGDRGVDGSLDSSRTRSETAWARFSGGL